MAESKTYTESERFQILGSAAKIGMAPAAKKAGMAGDATIRSWIDKYPDRWLAELAAAIKATDDPKAPARRLAASYGLDPETGEVVKPWKPSPAKKAAKKATKKSAKKAPKAKATAEPKAAKVTPVPIKHPTFDFAAVAERAPLSERPLLERIRDLEAQVARLTALIG